MHLYKNKKIKIKVRNNCGYKKKNNKGNNGYSNISSSIENNVYVDSSVCEKVFNFLLGGRSINNSIKEWKDLFKCQMKSGAYSDTPFLVFTAVLLQSIIPIAIGQQWSLFNRFKSNLKSHNSYVSLYDITRELRIPPLSAVCAISQLRCFRKWKNSSYIINCFTNNIPTMSHYLWTKE